MVSVRSSILERRVDRSRHDSACCSSCGFAGQKRLSCIDRISLVLIPVGEAGKLRKAPSRKRVKLEVEEPIHKKTHGRQQRRQW